MSFIVILLHVGTYSGTKRRSSQDHVLHIYRHTAMKSKIMRYESPLVTQAIDWASLELNPEHSFKHVEAGTDGGPKDTADTCQSEDSL